MKTRIIVLTLFAALLASNIHAQTDEPVDSDSDGIPDEYELATGMDPNAFDATRDLDNDGYTNAMEYFGGSDAGDPASMPLVTTSIFAFDKNADKDMARFSGDIDKISVGEGQGLNGSNALVINGNDGVVNVTFEAVLPERSFDFFMMENYQGSNRGTLRVYLDEQHVITRRGVNRLADLDISGYRVGEYTIRFEYTPVADEDNDTYLVIDNINFTTPTDSEYSDYPFTRPELQLVSYLPGNSISTDTEKRLWAISGNGDLLLFRETLNGERRFITYRVSTDEVNVIGDIQQFAGRFMDDTGTIVFSEETVVDLTSGDAMSMEEYFEHLMLTYNNSAPEVRGLYHATVSMNGSWVVLAHRLNLNGEFNRDVVQIFMVNRHTGEFRNATGGIENILPTYMSRTSDVLVSKDGEYVAYSYFGTSILNRSDSDTTSDRKRYIIHKNTVTGEVIEVLAENDTISPLLVGMKPNGQELILEADFEDTEGQYGVGDIDTDFIYDVRNQSITPLTRHKGTASVSFDDLPYNTYTSIVVDDNISGERSFKWRDAFPLVRHNLLNDSFDYVVSPAGISFNYRDYAVSADGRYIFIETNDNHLLPPEVKHDLSNRTLSYNIVRLDLGSVGEIEEPVVEEPKFKDFDYDGDGKADIGVRRPGNFFQYILPSSGAETMRVQFGRNENDIPVMGDFDGDKIADVAVRRPSNQMWYIRNSSDGEIQRVNFGKQEGDIPVPADYDGDGITDIAVRRPSNQMWYIRNSSDAEIQRINFGKQEGDIPVPADYDGDGITDVAVRRPSNQYWYIKNSSDGATQSILFGRQEGDIPVPADYDGDGKADVAVRRPSNQTWYILNSSDGEIQRIVFGRDANDIPIPADYDGDGKADVAVRRPGNQFQYILNSSDSEIQRIQFGRNSGDIALAAPVTTRMNWANGNSALLLENVGSANAISAENFEVIFGKEQNAGF